MPYSVPKRQHWTSVLLEPDWQPVLHLIECAKFLKNIFQGRPGVDVDYLRCGNHPFLIDEEECPLGGTVGAQHAVLRCYLPMRPEVGEHIEPELTHLLRPGVEGGNIIDGDAKQHGIALAEPVFDNIVTGPLPGAYRRPRRRYKGEHDVGFATKISKRHIVS